MNFSNKHILLICVSSQGVINFRSNLIKKLLDNNYIVSIIAFDSLFKNDIEQLGCNFYCIEDNNRSINPLKILSLKKRYMKLIKQIQPSVVFTFMLKPNIFGVLASHKLKIKKIYSMVEGAGDAFINNTFKWKVIRFVICRLYKQSFKYVNKVFFLNNDDKNEFIKRKLISEEKCKKINGIGVDLEKFSEKPITVSNSFLMVARMLKSKGIFEYCECARKVKQKYPNAVFNYLGAEGNVRISDIQEYIDDNSIAYLGVTKDVRPYLVDATGLILPSYREGIPMSIMEAEAMGRAIITTNSVGCKETLIDGYNGFIVEQKNVDSLVEKAIWMIEHPEETIVMGQNSRRFAEEHFDQEKINEEIIEVIDK